MALLLIVAGVKLVKGTNPSASSDEAERGPSQQFTPSEGQLPINGLIVICEFNLSDPPPPSGKFCAFTKIPLRRALTCRLTSANLWDSRADNRNHPYSVAMRVTDVSDHLIEVRHCGFTRDRR